MEVGAVWGSREAKYRKGYLGWEQSAAWKPILGIWRWDRGSWKERRGFVLGLVGVRPLRSSRCSASCWQGPAAAGRQTGPWGGYRHLEGVWLPGERVQGALQPVRGPPRLRLSPSRAGSQLAGTGGRGDRASRAPGDPSQALSSRIPKKPQGLDPGPGGGRASPGPRGRVSAQGDPSSLVQRPPAEAEVGRSGRWRRARSSPDAGRGRTELGAESRAFPGTPELAALAPLQPLCLRRWELQPLLCGGVQEEMGGGGED